MIFESRVLFLYYLDCILLIMTCLSCCYILAMGLKLIAKNIIFISARHACNVFQSFVSSDVNFWNKYLHCFETVLQRINVCSVTLETNFQQMIAKTICKYSTISPWNIDNGMCPQNCPASFCSLIICCHHIWTSYIRMLEPAWCQSPN